MYLEDLGGSLCINGAEDIIKDVDFTILVDSMGELNALILPAIEIDTTLAYLCLVSVLHQLQVFLQTADPDDIIISFPVHGLPKQNVLFDGAGENPCSLRYICRGTAHYGLQQFQKLSSVNKEFSQCMLRFIILVEW